MKQGFIIYTNTYPAIKDLTLEEKGLLLETIFLYELKQPLPKLSSTVQMAFNFIKISLENDTEKYNTICERNRTNGVKGGRPKNKPKKPSGLSGNPKNPDGANINININKNIKEEKEYTKLSYLLTIPSKDLEEIAKDLGISEQTISLKGIQLHEYCEAHGKTYKNYRAFLKQCLRKDNPPQKINNLVQKI